MNSGTIDRRQLTFKALAGLVGGALGWLPVEIADHGRSITEAASTGQRIGEFFTMALMAGLIGGMILAADEQTLEVTPQTQRRFLRGFILCFILSIPANYYSNVVFQAILNLGGWDTGHPGSLFSLIMARLVGWTLMGMMLGVGVGLGLSEGLEVALATGDGLVRFAAGLDCGASGPFAVQLAIATSDRRSTTPFLMAT